MIVIAKSFTELVLARFRNEHFTRTEILKRLRAKIAGGKPIIGGGAGTGLSAKCEEAGGIDLIVIYNSGRFRMAGRGGMRRSIVAPWSIRQRVETLGGQLVVERRKDVGVKIEIILPPFVLSA